MSRPSRLLLAATAAMALLLSAAASAQRFYDPPGRVARISDMRGDIAYSPGGDGDWYTAHRNRPLVRGDALWSDRGARAELQAGSTWVRIDQETSLEFLELSDRMLQVEVAEGNVNVRIRRMYPGQRVEVDTPNLALVLDRPGNFRIDVDREGDTTTIEARQGGGMVYGVGGRFPLRSGDVVVFYGEDVRDYELYAFPSADNFDRYTRIRDQRIDRSPALRYLGDDLVGFSDLDDYGRWSRYPDYGAVWFPSNVYSGWAPYQDGQWIWQEPWGWTWVDDEPWGFAPSHYGRWAWIEGRWGWIPGSRTSRSVYAPALVAFIEDVAGSIGWFPLGPGDVYYPSYSVSSNYFNQINVSNSARTSANVGRAYSSYGRANSVPLVQGAYRNSTVPTAVTVVPKDVFTNSRPVREAAARDGARAPRVPGEMRRNLSVRPGAASARGAAASARVRPPRAVEDEQVFVRTAPPAEQATPSATTTPAPAPAVRERPRRVRMITEQSTTSDARARGPRTEAPAQPGAAPAATPAGSPTATPVAPGGRLQQLDREALPRARGGRRFQERQQQAPQAATPSPATPAAQPAPTAEPAARAADAAADEARQAEEARAAAQKAREERRQAMEAERKSEQEQRQAEQAQREATTQRAQADADRDAQQQREAAAAEAKAAQEQQQARAAEREAQRQQRESERAQRQAEQQQKEAAQAAAVTPAPAAAPAEAAAATDESPRDRRCVPAERIEAMRKRGVSEERIAELKVCPAEETPPPQP